VLSTVLPKGRLEVVGTASRHGWSEDENLKDALESLQAPRQVAATARRYGISRSPNFGVRNASTYDSLSGTRHPCQIGLS
jgi:transposase